MIRLLASELLRTQGTDREMLLRARTAPLFHAASVELDSITCMALLLVSFTMSSPFNIQHDGMFTNPQVQKIHNTLCKNGVPPSRGVVAASPRRGGGGGLPAPPIPHIPENLQGPHRLFLANP